MNKLIIVIYHRYLYKSYTNQKKNIKDVTNHAMDNNNSIG